MIYIHYMHTYIQNVIVQSMHALLHFTDHMGLTQECYQYQVDNIESVGHYCTIFGEFLWRYGTDHLHVYIALPLPVMQSIIITQSAYAVGKVIGLSVVVVTVHKKITRSENVGI